MSPKVAKRKRSTVAAVAGLVAVVIAGVTVPTVIRNGGGSGGGGGYADPSVWVSTAGNDSTCARLDETKPCLTFQKAYDISAAGGDVISVAAGSYAAQAVYKGSHGQSGPVTAFVCATHLGCVLSGTISIGVVNGQVAPSYLTFDGFDVQGLRIGGSEQFDSMAIATHITFQNNWIHHWGSGPSVTYPLISEGSDYFTLQDNEIGPACCDGDGWEPGVANLQHTGNLVGFSHMTISGNYFHDIYDTCRTTNTTRTPTMNRLGGACSGIGFGDTAANGCTASCETSPDCCDHVDVMQLSGVGDDMVITNNRIYNAGTQGIFISNFFGTPGHNMTVAGNLIGKVCGGACGVDVSIGAQDGQAGTISGNVFLGYNTVAGDLTLGIGSHDFAAGTTVKVIGNIAGSWTARIGNAQGCNLGLNPSGTLTPTYSNNIFANRTCSGPNSLLGSATLVSTSAINPDLRLFGSQFATAGGESVYCGPGKTVSDDLFGTSRPSSGCSIGGYQVP